MNGEHLHISEIALFRKGPFSREEVREATRHLLICRDCRDLLPKPSPQEFLKSISIEQDNNSEKLKSSFSHSGGFFSSLGGFRPMLQPIAAVALLMIVTAGLSFMILLEPSASTDENLVASVNDNQLTGSDQILPVPGHEIYQPSNSDRIGDPKSEAGLTNRRQAIKTEKPKGKPLQVPASSTRVETQTRSVDGPCGFNESISLETSVSDDGIRLTWNKVTHAAKYSVYISDLEEKLVDQFETDDETSYVSGAKFERDIVYKWRLIITLKSGETIIGDSQNFSLNGPNGNINTQRKFQLPRQKSMNIRCTEKN
ncbi:MAG: hypothetical protein WBD22_13855 [Pyrinomonadaceae bacterium]